MVYRNGRAAQAICLPCGTVIFLWGFREGDAPVEPSWAVAQRPQAKVRQFAARKCSAGASLSRPRFSLGKMNSKLFRAAFQIVEQAVADGSIPGACVLIMQHGKVIEQRAFGVCELDPPRPFQTDSICWIASLTKPITATAAMKLVEQGKLQLDSPIEEYLPQFSQLATKDGQRHAVTLRQLMSHSSGIPASVPLREPYFFKQSWYDRSLQQVVDAIAKRPLDFAPGSKVNYSGETKVSGVIVWRVRLC